MQKTQFTTIENTQNGFARLFNLYEWNRPYGNVFFVDSAHASASNSAGSGRSPGSPLATIAYAIGLCTADNDDVIVCAPTHVETITGAAGVAANKAGVRIVGLGVGQKRSRINFTTAVGASFDISAAGVTLENFWLSNGIDNQTAMVNVTAADVVIRSCDFETNTGTTGAALGILTATAPRLLVENCVFRGPATNSGTTTTAQIDHEAGVDYIIRNNFFTGKMTQAITNGAAVLRGLIDNNRFVVYTGTKAINMHASSTPFVSNNRINVPSGTAPIVSAAGFMAGNVYSAAAGVTAGTASTF